nr:hypothetical transcript [Hymenolepis microstoma]
MSPDNAEERSQLLWVCLNHSMFNVTNTSFSFQHSRIAHSKPHADEGVLSRLSFGLQSDFGFLARSLKFNILNKCVCSRTCFILQSSRSENEMSCQEYGGTLSHSDSGILSNLSSCNCEFALQFLTSLAYHQLRTHLFRPQRIIKKLKLPSTSNSGNSYIKNRYRGTM